MIRALPVPLLLLAHPGMVACGIFAISPHFATVVFTAIGGALAASSGRVLVGLAGIQDGERWLLLFLFAMNGPLQSGIKESRFVLRAIRSPARGATCLCGSYCGGAIRDAWTVA